MYVVDGMCATHLSLGVVYVLVGTGAAAYYKHDDKNGHVVDLCCVVFALVSCERARVFFVYPSIAVRDIFDMDMDMPGPGY